MPFATEPRSVMLIMQWAQGWKYSTSTLGYVRGASKSFCDPHSRCWATRLRTDSHGANSSSKSQRTYFLLFLRIDQKAIRDVLWATTGGVFFTTNEGHPIKGFTLGTREIVRLYNSLCDITECIDSSVWLGLCRFCTLFSSSVKLFQQVTWLLE